MQDDRRWRRASLLGLMFFLGACAHGQPASDAPAPGTEEINKLPANYKAEILAAMHAYLNDPTGIHDAAISEPAFKTVAGNQRYIVCVRFSAKKHAKESIKEGSREGRESKDGKDGKDGAGAKELAAVFMVGRFDHFVEKAQEACAGVSYTPFPELEKLTR